MKKESEKIHVTVFGMVFFSSMLCALGLSHSEYKRFVEVVCMEARSKYLTGLIVSGNSLEEDLDLLSHAESVGCSHVFLDVKRNDTNKSEDMLYSAFRQRIDATRLPIILYGSVSNELYQIENNKILINVYDRLAELPTVIGLKLTQTMNINTAFQFCERLGDRLLIGPVNLDFVPILAKHYRIQWSGQWNVESCQTPDKPLVVEFINLINEKSYDKAIELYWKIVPALRGFYDLQAPCLSKGGHPWSHMKYYQWCAGGNGGLLRNLQESLDRVPVLNSLDRQQIKLNYEHSGLEITDKPDEQFVVGRANWDKGVRIADLSETPQYAKNISGAEPR